MSRTLHYGVTNNFKLNGKQAFSIFQLVNEYKARYDWTAETVDLSEFRIYPTHDLALCADWKEAQIALYNRITRMVHEGINFYNALTLLENQEIINVRKNVGLRGLTNVSSNELNAHTVIQFIIAVSKLIPDAILYLIDEGYALYCDILVQNCLAKPHLENIKKYISNNNGQDDAKTNARMEYYKKLIGLNPQFGNYEQYVRPLLVESYLIERKEFQTTEFGIQDIDNIGQFLKNIIFSEKEQSAKYYKDIDSYPL